MSSYTDSRREALEHPAITVTDQSVIINIVDAREAEESRYAHGVRKAHLGLLWHARQLVEEREEVFAAERREREEALAKAKILQQHIFDLLTADELRALNAAGLGGAVSRIAAGLNAAEGDVRVRVELPKGES